MGDNEVLDLSCPDTECKIEMGKRIGRRLKKSTVAKVSAWCGLPLLALLGYGVILWAQQEADPLRYTTKQTFSAHVADNAKTKAVVDNMREAQREGRAVQREIQSDVKEILRYMRKPP